MPSILGTDKTFNLPDFTLVIASAGSGKTHTLTLRYLQLLLSPRIPHHQLKNILAITFTNNAAAEMKQRIIQYLKCAYLDIPLEGLNELKESISLDDETFRRRAGESIGLILDSYSDFQVQTIDSFIIRLLKVSAVEFGFAPQFDVSFSLTPLLDEAIAYLTRGIIRDPQTLSLLEEVTTLLEENRGADSAFLWNPLSRLSGKLASVVERLNAYRGEPLAEQWSENKNEAKKNLLRCLIEIAAIADRGSFKLTSNFAKIIESVKHEDVEAILGKSLTQKAMLKSTGRPYEKAAEKIASLQEEAARYTGEYLEAVARTYYQPYVRVQQLLSGTMELIRRRRGEVQLAGANRELATRINDELVPEIYFSLGERIHHYLLDEFQDTAPVQWSALRPLIENSLAGQGSLFLVGDTKQSIYTFRGADWQIMKRMIVREEFPSALCNRKELPYNWRSSEAIVRFVNHVFHDLIPKTGAAQAAAESGLSTFKQEVRPGREGTGLVEVTIFDPDGQESVNDLEFSPERTKLLSVIQDCRSRGYKDGDIAILTPKNSSVVEVSRWLNAAGIKFLSHSSLDIRTRAITGELIALLKFLDSPIDDLSFTTFFCGKLYQSVLRDAKKEFDVHGFLLSSRSTLYADAPLYTLFRESYPELWNTHFENLFNLVGYLPVYDLIAELYTLFDVFRRCAAEEATVVKLLEVIREFENEGSNSLKDFLLFTEQSDDDDVWNMEKSGSADAVTVMTVHKAKGLGFPVVIALFYDTSPMHDNLFIEEEGESLRLTRTTKAAAEKSEALDEVYQRHALRKKIDELNKLYVALTRAREEMFVLCVKGSRAHEPSDFLPQDGFTIGKRSIAKPKEAPVEREAPLLHSPTRGLPKTSGLKWIGIKEIRRGDLVHALFASTIFIDKPSKTELKESLAKIEEEIRSLANIDELANIIEKFINSTDINPFFKQIEGRKVLNEQDIVGSDGRLRRLDRLIIDPALVTIVDYKTGSEREEYNEQLEDYGRIVQQLYPDKKITAALAYVDLCIVKRVV